MQQKYQKEIFLGEGENMEFMLKAKYKESETTLWKIMRTHFKTKASLIL
jgi:hypothetical protein